MVSCQSRDADKIHPGRLLSRVHRAVLLETERREEHFSLLDSPGTIQCRLYTGKMWQCQVPSMNTYSVPAAETSALYPVLCRCLPHPEYMSLFLWRRELRSGEVEEHNRTWVGAVCAKPRLWISKWDKWDPLPCFMLWWGHLKRKTLISLVCYFWFYSD